MRPLKLTRTHTHTHIHTHTHTHTHSPFGHHFTTLNCMHSLSVPGWRCVLAMNKQWGCEDVLALFSLPFIFFLLLLFSNSSYMDICHWHIVYLANSAAFPVYFARCFFSLFYFIWTGHRRMLSFVCTVLVSVVFVKVHKLESDINCDCWIAQFCWLCLQKQYLSLTVCVLRHQQTRRFLLGSVLYPFSTLTAWFHRERKREFVCVCVFRICAYIHACMWCMHACVSAYVCVCVCVCVHMCRCVHMCVLLANVIKKCLKKVYKHVMTSMFLNCCHIWQAEVPHLHAHQTSRWPGPRSADPNSVVEVCHKGQLCSSSWGHQPPLFLLDKMPDNISLHLSRKQSVYVCRRVNDG